MTLAVGIGAATAVYSIVQAVLLRPLPYADADRLVAIWDGHLVEKNLSKIFASYEDFENWNRNSRSFDGLAAATWATGDQILTGRGPAKVVLAVPATVELFSILGARAAMGRTFDPDDLRRGCSVVLAHRFWQDALGAPPDIVGQSLALDDRACLVLGVMPARFAFYPDATDMWSVIAADREPPAIGVFGRLKPGVTLAQAQAEVFALHKQAHGGDRHGASFAPTVYNLQDEFTWMAGRNLRLTLLVLFAAVNLVLVIACVNVANLLLGRSVTRQREVAVRGALGAGRWRLLRQLVTEALLLSALATGAGIVLAVIAVRYFRLASPVDLPPGTLVTVDGNVLAFTSGLAVATAVLFGLAPAWSTVQAPAGSALRTAGGTASRPSGRRRLGQTLVLIEMTCAVVLLAGASLLIASVGRLGAEPLGFDPDGVLALGIKLPTTNYATARQRERFYDRLIESVNAASQSQAVAVSTTLVRGHASNFLAVEGRPAPSPESLVPDVDQDIVSADYFRVLRIPLHQGRFFGPGDRQGSEPVAVVSEALVRKYFPGESPLGRRIKYGNDSPWITVVGVVGTQKSRIVYQEMSWVETPFLFRPVSQLAPLQATLLVRTARDPADGSAFVQRLIAAIDPDVPVSGVETLRQRISRELSYPRFRALLLAAFAGIALLLATVGMYAVLAQEVAHRTHEFGIRMALGASPKDVLLLVAKHCLVPAGAGLAGGLAAAAGLGRAFAALLYGIRPTDATTIVTVSLILAAAAVLASYLPGRRATRIDPMVALRHE